MGLTSKIPTINRRAPIRVVIVEPDEPTRQAMEATLTRWGYAAYGLANLARMPEILIAWYPRFAIVGGELLAREVIDLLDPGREDPRIVLVEDEGAAPLVHPRIIATLQRPIPYHTLLELLQRPARSDAPSRETGTAAPPLDGRREGSAKDKLVLTEDAWRARLSAAEYRVLREHGTEPAFVGCFVGTKDAGTYVCAGCGNPLFQSGLKFESGTGWPSFTAPVHARAIVARDDHSHGMVRTEVLCARCDGHLGHVFPDGPAPTGLRYCINAIAMRHVPEGQAIVLVTE